MDDPLINPPAIVSADRMDLERYAFQANEALEAAGEAGRTTLERYRDAGRALQNAKARVPHGQWLKWLEKNGIDRFQSARAIRIAANWAKCASDAHLKETFRLLAQDGEEQEKAQAAPEPSREPSPSPEDEPEPDRPMGRDPRNIRDDSLPADCQGILPTRPVDPDGPRPLYDERHIAIPRKLRPMFEDKHLIHTACRMIREARDAVESLAGSPASVLLGGDEIRRITRELNGMAVTLHQWRPFGVCPSCEATQDSCHVCKGRGAVIKAVMNQPGIGRDAMP